MINYEEATDATLKMLKEKKEAGEDDTQLAMLAIAAADQIGKLLCKPLVEAAVNDIPLMFYIVFPGAFEVAKNAFYDFCKEHAPEDFADDAKKSAEIILGYSREGGFLKEFKAANEKSKKNDGE